MGEEFLVLLMHISLEAPKAAAACITTDWQQDLVTMLSWALASKTLADVNIFILSLVNMLSHSSP